MVNIIYDRSFSYLISIWRVENRAGQLFFRIFFKKTEEEFMCLKRVF